MIGLTHRGFKRDDFPVIAYKCSETLRDDEIRWILLLTEANIPPLHIFEYISVYKYMLKGQKVAQLMNVVIPSSIVSVSQFDL